MLARERQDIIIRLVRERGSVTTSELMAMLGASESTVRRDLEILDKQHQLSRVRGGATATISRARLIVHDASVAQKRDVNTVAKRAIGARAAALVGPDDFVYIDAGTSTMQLAEAITQTEATYFTNSIPHAQLLLAKGCKTYLPGGMVKPLTEALVGEATIASLENLHFTLGFWGTNGISREAGFTTPEYSEAKVKEVSMVHTLRRYVLADQSKFDQVSLVTFASFEDATILTDQLPSDGSFQDADNVVEVGSSS
ncbi:MAG: DeoR/GlpR family DNA-binding transcription regulator [Olsenella sp.]|jgi:DeoR family fructose operon transcriptional repressor|nr:DeoR/GlpR family DNA-binding transcription regulator [Olsenella sp.]MCI2183147.1 DeoR/GlpR family DNA-binding transcription regulator [Olsenella sp.]MCI2186759.1 DeoR/GlpR family DNA-binding transcription regulator [Olsenella sp.]